MFSHIDGCNFIPFVRDLSICFVLYLNNVQFLILWIFMNILYELDGNKTFKFTLPERPGSLFVVEEAE